MLLHKYIKNSQNLLGGVLYDIPTPPNIFGKKLCSYVVEVPNVLIMCGFSKVHKSIYRYLVKYILFF